MSRSPHWNKTLLGTKFKNPFLTVQGALDEAMDDFYHLIDVPRFTKEEFENLSMQPLIDIVESKNCLKLEVEMPGLSEKEIHVSIDNGVLQIKGEKSTSKKDKGGNYLRREIGYGYYERNITLPNNVDTNKAKASFKKGMLWIEIPKTKTTTKHSHEIKIEKIKEPK